MSAVILLQWFTSGAVVPLTPLHLQRFPFDHSGSARHSTISGEHASPSATTASQAVSTDRCKIAVMRTKTGEIYMSIVVMHHVWSASVDRDSSSDA